ncbi:MAG TPA: NAD(P)H-binding protein [Kofleriaceae bacterium]|nr:NAD(P)H-binding protein [Kofleriaceae bacterium]
MDQARKLTFTVTTATGRIGKPVALGLLDAGHRVRAVGRDRARLQPLVDRGAEPVVGDIADRAFVEGALAGADAAFLVVRADLRSPTFGADFRRVGRAYADAARATRLPDAVFLSAMGAHDRSLAGLIGVHGEVERMLDEVATLRAVHLRAASFIENLFYFLPLMHARGVLASPIAPDAPVDWAATRDVATAALKGLGHAPFRSGHAVEVRREHPVPLRELARAIEDRLGRPFPSELTPRDADVAAMVAGGASLDFATRMNDTWEIFSARGVRGEPEITVLSTRPIEDFIAAELVPAIERGPGGEALASA